MPQHNIFDFRAPDSSASLNEMHRMIIPPGVYHGFNISLHPTPGQLVLQHDPNPDFVSGEGGGIASDLGAAAMAWISVLKTRDVITCIEASDVDLPAPLTGRGYYPLHIFGDPVETPPTGSILSNVAVTFSTSHSAQSADAGYARVDYLVARYNYSSLLTQPGAQPKVIYDVVEGTAGNKDDSQRAYLPTLASDEVLIAEIRLKDGTTPANFTAPGQVTVVNVNKKKLDNTLVDVGGFINGFLRPGVYYGYEPTVTGTNPPLVTLSAGGYISQDGDFIKDDNPQSDPLLDVTEFTIPTPTVGVWVIAIVAVNYPGFDTSAPEVPAYILVNSFGPDLPSTALMVTEAQSQVDARCTEDNITPLIYIRINETGSGTFVDQVSKTERISLPDELLVTDGVFYKGSSFRVGARGLRDTLDLIWGVVRYEANPRRHRIIAEGLFFHESDFNVPSAMEISGWRSTSIHRMPNSGVSLDLSGIIDIDKSFEVFDPGAGEIPAEAASVNPGFSIRKLVIATSQDYLAKQFVYGDPILFWDGAALLEGLYYSEAVGGGVGTILAIFVTDSLPDGSHSGDIAVLKQSTSLSQASVEAGTLKAYATTNGVLGLVNASNIVLGYNQSLLAANLSVSQALQDAVDAGAGAANANLFGSGNRINRIEILGSVEGVFGKSNNGTSIQNVTVREPSSGFILYGEGNHLNDCFGELTLEGVNCLIGLVYAPSPKWENAVIVGAGSFNSVVLKKIGSVDYSAAAGTFNQIDATRKVLSGTGIFKGSNTGAAIVLPGGNELEENAYRVSVMRRDDTPNDAADGTDYGVSPIGEIWIDGGPARARSQFIVKNAGWLDGDGPLLDLTLGPSDFIDIGGGVWEAQVTLDFPVVQSIPGTVSISVVDGSGGGTANDATGPFVLSGNITLVTLNYLTGALIIRTSVQPSSATVQWQNGPWPFDWVAIQD